MYKEKTNVN